MAACLSVIRKDSIPSITGVTECFKLRKRCCIRVQIRRKLLRDDADLPPWLLAIFTSMASNSHTTNQFWALAVDNRAAPSLDHIP